MWRSNDILVEERPSMSSADFLQQPELHHAHPHEAAVCSIMEQEEEKIVEGIEEETDENMDCKDKQTVQSIQSTSLPVSHSLANQIQANATENATNIQQIYNPVGKHQASCKLPCPRCERRFTSSQGLERHMQTHAHTQHYKCSRCRRTFSTLFSRRRHEKRHENRNRKPDHRSNTTYGVSQNVPGSSVPVNTVNLSKGDKVLPNPDSVKYTTSDGKQKGASNKNNDAKASNLCKYCKKAFRTNTSLRRHQRRIHEFQLLPKRVCKNVTITQESEGEKLVEPLQDSQTTSPQCMENNSQEREYMVDISSNISENLSFYIDGKIVSTSAVSNCGMIQMTSEGSVIGLNAIIISPAQISQALNIEANTCTSDLSGQSSTKRRTSTPPLLPQIKTELESESILTASSSSLSLSLTSTSGTTLVATHLPESTETVAFHGERTVYLSPKLKQLLQNQDGKPAIALITEGQKLGAPLSLTVLPPTTKFKRRTTSPPSSSQQSTDLSVESVIPDLDSAETEDSKLDNHKSPGLSFPCNAGVGHLNLITKNSDGVNMQHVLPLNCSVSITGGNSCNQQPLDLSSSMSNAALAESILDLSVGGKSIDCDSEGVYLTQPAFRKTKPNSVMLQKVLMNECSGVDIPSVDVPATADVFGGPDITNFAVMALPDSGLPNPEKLLFEFTLPSASLDSTTSLLAPVNIHTAAQIPPTQAVSSSSPPFVSFLPTPTAEPNQIQTLCSTLLVSDTVPPTSNVEDCIDYPVHLTQGDFKVTIPDWVSSAPGGVTHTLIPAAPSMNLQGPHWVSDPALGELAQRTLVVDSVLASDVQMFPPSLPVDQSGITPLTFPTNTVVIEYTVALQSTENILPSLPANSVQCVSDNISVNTITQQEHQSQPLSLENTIPLLTTQSTPAEMSSTSTDGTPTLTASISAVKEESKEEGMLNSVSPANANIQTSDYSEQDNKVEDELSPLNSFCKNFMCNVCEQPFQSMKSLSQHVREHSKEWPYKCEFCVQLFDSDTGLLEHRSSYHGIGKIYVCKTCSKEFAFLCNLEQHQRDLHPGQECSHTEAVHGKLRPENHNNPKADINANLPLIEGKRKSDNTTSKAEVGDLGSNSTEELYTTIKIMASGGVKPKAPDVRLGINQHYPSFKPPPFPYHNRTPTGTTVASATNFTTHNIPQTFSTAIRCTKCGKSFDNMPELHKHILACANASDRKRYTPKKNPVPLKQFAKAQNGVLSPAKIVNSRQNFTKKITFHESSVKMNILNKRKSRLMQKGRPAGGRKAFAQDDLGVYACPHCSREFTYTASLKKHIAFSCPMRPAIGNPKKRNHCIVSAQENNRSLRRQIANPHGSNHDPKMITKSQINKPNTSVDTTQNIRLKRSTVLSTSVVQSSKKGSFIPQIVLSSSAQVNSQEAAVRVHVLGNKVEQRVEDVKIQPRREECLSLRLRERAGGPVTRSVQQSTATTGFLKHSDSHNIIVRPVVLQVKK
ncbi:PR domain zinc finger protein 2 isoform X1 [Triplophysa dalaica]|uniref:PR domain zinc finger protein 2 isoform X1 n=1 Tax=Triplophysa dalaica TaxID=1582913 RepID=UPI0024DF6EED|nr:PR domain zinc finger protein 2 isoform X1 [Triplophysa dalaica]